MKKKIMTLVLTTAMTAAAGLTRLCRRMEIQ